MGGMRSHGQSGKLKKPGLEEDGAIRWSCVVFEAMAGPLCSGCHLV